MSDSPTTRATIARADLDAAAVDGLITASQADALWARWSPRAVTLPAVAGPRFGFTNVLYYFGGMIAIGSMSLFMGLAWNAFGPGGLLAIALASIAGCLYAAGQLERRALPVPAGILATLAIVLVPLATWCLQHVLNLWPDGEPSWHSISDYHAYIDGRWLVMEAATLVAAGLMFVRHRHPFMVMPIAVTIWYVSMDLVNAIVRHGGTEDWSDSWDLQRNASLVFGLVTVLVALWVDLRVRRAGSRRDFAFWLYLLGTAMFWVSLSLSHSGSALGKLAYCAINVALVLFGAAIGRRVFTVFGAFGVMGYLGYLAHDVFEDSLAFPFALAALGLAIVGLGIWWQRHEARLHARLAQWLPPLLRPLGEAQPA